MTVTTEAIVQELLSSNVVSTSFQLALRFRHMTPQVYPRCGGRLMQRLLELRRIDNDDDVFVDKGKILSAVSGQWPETLEKIDTTSSLCTGRIINNVIYAIKGICNNKYLDCVFPKKVFFREGYCMYNFFPPEESVQVCPKEKGSPLSSFGYTNK